jgi:formate dehydrogenase subunit delta
MDIHHLVDMANRIGDFFSSMPDRAEAKSGIALHIKKFWEPRMKLLLIDGLDSPDTRDLQTIVREAVTEHKAQIQPRQS